MDASAAASAGIDFDLLLSSSSKEATLSPTKLREQLAHVNTFVERALYAEQSAAGDGLTGDVRDAADVW